SLVGSYEESILSGRMSTLPSKPISFIAEIGVIGLAKCKSSLKCPPHLTLPFHAYFYELPGDESPSTPYVGTIYLQSQETGADGPGDGIGNGHSEVPVREELTVFEPDHTRFKASEGYRLPGKGQLQVIIKNQSRTAAKVFLLQYDFRDMPPNTKTFLRQKVYT
ncbi:uncharacterized protein BJ171DRAFT_396383, partial [Polychytrium aggregatum]|uniref:uncharacterized protein n=1 Tax=Polychytrium aggregatum TaxID=110093 RepID=UPI0022FEC836